MKRLIATFLLLLVNSLACAGQGAEYVNGYFELWLKAHNFKEFEKKNTGILFTKNGVLLDGEIHGVNELNSGKFYSVESRISVVFKSGRRLDDFVAGMGDSPTSAFQDSLQNFCLTTLHPIYAELFDHADPHVRKETWSIGDSKRRVFLSEWGQRGQKIDDSTQKGAEALLVEEFQKLNLSKDIHWVKLVVAGNNGSLGTLVVTVDGVQNAKITERLAAYRWPRTDGLFMAKLFFVIGSR